MLNLLEQEFPFGDEQTAADVTEEAAPFSVIHSVYAFEQAISLIKVSHSFS